MRSVTQDVGKKHFIRHDLHLSLGIVLCIGALIILILNKFDVLEIPFEYTVILVLQTGFFFIVIVAIMLNGAFINEHFRIHKSILERCKGICTDLFRLGDYYFDENTVAQNFMYRFGIGLMRLNYETNRAFINIHLENLIGIFNTGIADLKHNEVYQPFMLLGISVSLPLIKSIIVGLLSILLAGLQEFIKKLLRK